MTGSAAEVPELPAHRDVRPPGHASPTVDERPSPTLDRRPSPTLCGRPVATDRALVMAIVNRTPDSFYDRGATFTDDAALAAVDRAVAEGADLVDIGGVKAGPGDLVDTAEEIRRVVPFVAAIRERYPDVLISVDTWRSEVARRAVAEGADLINDTWAGADPELVDVAAAGLLDGKRATTHWYYLSKMLRISPTVRYVPDRRMVSAAVSPIGKLNRVVLLIHENKKQTVRTLPEIIERYLEAGYVFRPLTANMEPIPGVPMGTPSP